MANANETAVVAYVKAIATELKTVADELSKIRKVLESGHRMAVNESKKKSSGNSTLISESLSGKKENPGTPLSKMTDEDYLEQIRRIRER